jgi:hypothetical protein
VQIISLQIFLCVDNFSIDIFCVWIISLRIYQCIVDFFLCVDHISLYIKIFLRVNHIFGEWIMSFITVSAC